MSYSAALPGLVLALTLCSCAQGPTPRLDPHTGAAVGAPSRDESQDKQKKGQAKPEKLTNFVQKIPDTDVSFTMVAIPAGKFTMGSPTAEKERKKDEGPQREVTLSAFWIGKHEVRWDEYDLWSKSEKGVDGVTRPTPAYVDMSFGMGREGYPAICMTQLSAKTYCEWLSKVTGRHYRLPTEAEWEYACRAGSKTAYSFGDDPEKLAEYGWFEDNSDEEYHKVGLKKPNAWGVHDMHGNVAEWTLDQYKPYAKAAGKDPLVVPKTLYPRSTRGGGWSQPADRCRSAARIPSHEDWKDQDPQVPKSIWYHTDADFVGFRVVCEPKRHGAGHAKPKTANRPAKQKAAKKKAAK